MRACGVVRAGGTVAVPWVPRGAAHGTTHLHSRPTPSWHRCTEGAAVAYTEPHALAHELAHAEVQTLPPQPASPVSTAAHMKAVQNRDTAAFPQIWRGLRVRNWATEVSFRAGASRRSPQARRFLSCGAGRQVAAACHEPTSKVVNYDSSRRASLPWMSDARFLELTGSHR
jgi:hypothetical protein